jgi:site-specific DNA-methyltransferase (adenine-specific)
MTAVTKEFQNVPIFNKVPGITLFNMDCMEYLKSLPDKSFDLAIVDPPYGVGETWRKDRKSKFYKHTSSYKNEETPGVEYWCELRRVSINQIVWGGIFYTEYLPSSKAWIVWDKFRSRKTHMAEVDLAWTSFTNRNAIIYKIPWNGFIVSGNRHGEHPHEKPVELYLNCLNDFIEPGQRILDTHLGSGSIAIACHDYKFELVGCELDPDYFASACKRLENHAKQTKLF